MPLIFKNPTTALRGLQEHVKRLFEVEQSQVLEQLGFEYKKSFGEMGFDQQGHAVMIVSPYDAPLGTARSLWMDCFEEVRNYERPRPRTIHDTTSLLILTHDAT
jgi:hypothetical protein